MNQPSAETAIKILSALKTQTDTATLAYWVTPNTVLTLSGARAYCDGVFYHDDKKILKTWTTELADSIKALNSITDVYLAEAKIDKSAYGGDIAGYEVILTQGLDYVFENTKLLDNAKFELIQQKANGKKLITAMCSLLKKDERFKHFNIENLNHIAFGILVGYPDEAILGSVEAWEIDDPFAEPLVDADIRGSGYYTCPQPVYSYPRHMVTNPEIIRHELLWSSILKDFYTSEFHKYLAADKAFHQKAKILKLLR